MNDIDFQFGISKNFPCNYLPEQDERLLIAVDTRFQNPQKYAWLMGQGFRRSGDQIYRPQCEACQACHSIRVMINDFLPSKSQKRSLKRNSHLTVKHSSNAKDSYYPLYENYINTLHHDGAMYPANFDQYKSFLSCNITEQLFIELWDNDKLVGVAVTDVLPNALSAVYTFYDPSLRKNGLGVFSILNQINIAKSLNKPYLYLGYQIDDCQKMNYKNKYHPYQRLIKNTWHIINKSPL